VARLHDGFPRPDTGARNRYCGCGPPDTDRITRRQSASLAHSARFICSREQAASADTGPRRPRHSSISRSSRSDAASSQARASPGDRKHSHALAAPDWPSTTQAPAGAPSASWL